MCAESHQYRPVAANEGGANSRLLGRGGLTKRSTIITTSVASRSLEFGKASRLTASESFPGC